MTGNKIEIIVIEDSDEDEIIDITDETLENNQREKKELAVKYACQAKRCYETKDYANALFNFKKAVETDHLNSEYYILKSKCHYELEEIQEACNDAFKANSVAFGAHKKKSLEWLLQLTMNTGDIENCIEIIEGMKLFTLDSHFKTTESKFNVLKTCVESLQEENSPTKIIHLSTKALKIAPYSGKLWFYLAKAQMKCQRYLDAQIASTKALQIDPHNVRAQQIKCKAIYQSGDLAKAKLEIMNLGAMKKSPLSVQWLREIEDLEEQLRKTCWDSNLTGRKNSCLRCLDILSSSAMHNKTIEARVCIKMGEIAQIELDNWKALEWCERAIGLKENSANALILKGDIEMKEYLFEEAKRDYETALRYAPSEEANVKKKLKIAKRRKDCPDYYQLLGIDMTASVRDIKSAYKKCLLKYHPDKNAGASQYKMTSNKRKFQYVLDGYEKLSNLESKTTYDNDLKKSRMTDYSEWSSYS